MGLCLSFIPTKHFPTVVVRAKWTWGNTQKGKLTVESSIGPLFWCNYKRLRLVPSQCQPPSPVHLRQKNKTLCFFLLTSNGKVKTKPPPAIIFHSSIKYIAVTSALGSEGYKRRIAMHGLYHRKINEQSSDSLSKTKAKRGIKHPGWFINQEAKTFGDGLSSSVFTLSQVLLTATAQKQHLLYCRIFAINLLIVFVYFFFFFQHR